MSLSHQYVQDHILSMHGLNPTEQAALEEHLAACPECRAYATFHQALLESLSAQNAARLSELEIRGKIRLVNKRLEKRGWPTRICNNTFSMAGLGLALILLLASLIYFPRLMPWKDVPGRITTAHEITPVMAGGVTPTPVPWKTYTSWFESSAGTFHYRLQYPPNWVLYPGTTQPAPGLEGETLIINYQPPENTSLPDLLDGINPLQPGQVHLKIYALPCVSIGEAECQAPHPITIAHYPATRSVTWETLPESYTRWQVFLYIGNYRMSLVGTMPGLVTQNEAIIATLDQIVSTLVIDPGASPNLTAEPGLPFAYTLPLSPGTTWVYLHDGYIQAEGDPQKIIRGTSRIEERIADIQSASPYTLVHIQGKKTMISADPGWQENGEFPLGNYEYWYVIQNNQLYLSHTRPDPVQVLPQEMRLLYQFPLQIGSEWCPGPEIKGELAPDIGSCVIRSIVSTHKPYPSRLGELPSCYEIQVMANSGPVIREFCDGVGLVSEKYDHSGTRFGSDQQLIEFINGKDGTHLTAEMPTATSVPTQAAGDIQRYPSPDGQWTATHERKLGVITLVDAQGRQTRLSVGGQDHYLVPGSWSPDSHYLLAWQGKNSASIQVDGLPLWSVEVKTGRAIQLSKSVLVNPAYMDWAPDSHALIFTNGGYRSALVGKWLSLYVPASQQVTDLISQSELIPGAVVWSPGGKTIAFAAVDAAYTDQTYADYSGWDNPAILARRIYLLDASTGTYQRLNAADSAANAYQDAPRWGGDGQLYFVQLDQDQAHVMVTNPTSDTAHALPGCQAERLTPAGYYGQVDWSFLLDACPDFYPTGAGHD